MVYILKFKTIEIGDLERVTQILSKTNSNSCQMSFANLFCLRDKYGTEICIEDDALYIRQTKRIYKGMTAYFVPIGSTDLKYSIDLILEEARYARLKPYFFAVTDETAESLNRLAEYEFEITPQRDWFEYIYESKKLASFDTPEMAKQRRAVNSYMNLYGDETRIERISDENISEIKKFQKKWLDENLNKNDDKESLISENASVQTGLDNYTLLGLEGIALYVGKSIRGYAYGAVLPGGAFDIIAQKADVSYRQIYKVVLQEHVKTFCERAKLTNMEEDIGLVGLRRSKERYKPDYMLKKFTAEFV